MRRAAAGRMKKLTSRIDTWVTVSEGSELERESAVALVVICDGCLVGESIGGRLSDEACPRPRPIAVAAASPTRAPIRIIAGIMRALTRMWSSPPREYADGVWATRIIRRVCQPETGSSSTIEDVE